jgi:large subunit ribosomal protein L24
MKLRAGDHVVIISGKDKGKTGTVLRVLPEKQRIVVSDANMRTKHIKAQANRRGEIIRYEAAIHMSNVMLVDPKSKKRSRVGYKIDEKGRKLRVAKKSGSAVTVSAKPAAADGAKKAKGEKTEKKKETSKPDAPKKTPFWGRVGFGSDALEEADEKAKAATKNVDKTVPEQGRSTESFSHSRGS